MFSVCAVLDSKMATVQMDNMCISDYANFTQFSFLFLSVSLPPFPTKHAYFCTSPFRTGSLISFDCISMVNVEKCIFKDKHVTFIPNLEASY